MTRNFKVEYLKSLEDIFNFSSLDENYELFSNKNKQVIGKYKTEFPKNIWIDEFVCLRSKSISFKCGNNSKKKSKGTSKSQSKSIESEAYYNCLFGGNYQKECDSYFIRLVNHEMYLQKLQNSTISIFNDK